MSERKIELPIKVGQKFLSNGVPGAIISVTIDSPEYPVLWLSADGKYARYFMDDGYYSETKKASECDLQPIPAKITDGVEFCGEQYRAEFERLVAEGREFELLNISEWVLSRPEFFNDITYRLLPQHRDAVGNVLRVGDRVECEYGRAEIIKFLNQRAFFKEFGWKYCYHCRLLKTVTRPLRLDDLEKAQCPMLLCSGVRVHPVWTEKHVWVNAYRRGYDELEDVQWRPSADQPWKPCEVTEEVLA